MAIARVHTDRTYSQYWFFRNMRAAWDLAKDVKIRPLEDNLYTLQFARDVLLDRVFTDQRFMYKQMQHRCCCFRCRRVLQRGLCALRAHAQIFYKNLSKIFSK